MYFGMPCFTPLTIFGGRVARGTLNLNSNSNSAKGEDGFSGFRKEKDQNPTRVLNVGRGPAGWTLDSLGAQMGF